MTNATDGLAPAAGAHRPPTHPPGSVARVRLDDRYDGASGRVVRVLAPPGYGKTSLVARWVAGERRPVRWVDLHRSDDDPVALFATLRSALAGIVDVVTPSAAHAAAVNPHAEALREALGSARPAGPLVLVLDDVHRVRSQEGNRLLSTLAEGISPGSTLVLAGRGHHDHGAIGRLRLVPGVVDVTVGDLAFDRDESRQLIQQMGVAADTPEVEELLSQLEGWPAGIRLAGRVLQAGAPLRGVADHVSVVDFLRGEWTARLDDDDRDFLREIACLHEVTAEACDEVLDRRGSARALRRLHREEVVVFALDERDDRYRLHGLLRRWLSTELHELDRERWTQVHRAAAGYCERRGDIDQAVDHALQAGDLAVTEAIVATHGTSYVTSGLDATVDRWLQAFPADHVRSSPALSALQSIRALQAGDDELALQWLRVLDRAVLEQGGGGAGPMRSWVDLLHGMLDERPAAELSPAVAKARANLAGGPWASLACLLHGAFCFVEGDVDAAREALRAGKFEAELAETQMLVGQCLAALSIIDDCTGDEVASSTHALLARDAIRSCGGELLPTTATAMASLALHHARRGERGAADQHVAAARAALLGFRSAGPWFNILTRLALLRAVLLLDDRATARTLAQELEHHARFEPRPDGTVACSALTAADELRARVEAMHAPARGSAPLTDAELRVLPLLPTNLSLEDIATQLFLSRNTVKSHVAAIYRKLGATKRGEAVEHARAAGLLPATTDR